MSGTAWRYRPGECVTTADMEAQHAPHGVRAVEDDDGDRWVRDDDEGRLKLSSYSRAHDLDDDELERFAAGNDWQDIVEFGPITVLCTSTSHHPNDCPCEEDQ